MKLLFKAAGKKEVYNSKEHPSPFTVKKLKHLAEPYFDVVDVSYKAGFYLSLKGLLFSNSFLPMLRVSPQFTVVLKKKS